MILAVTMNTVGFVFMIIGILLAGGIAGFFIARYIFKRQMEKNPPINEDMIRVMYMQMGRKPSEAQIKAVMNSMKKKQK